MNFVKRIPIIPTLLVLAAVAVMMRLGFWQLDRMEQKEAMLAQYTASQADSSYFPYGKLPADGSAAFRRVAVWCSSVEPATMQAGRNAQGEVGWVQLVRCSIGGDWPNSPIKQPDVVYQPADVALGWTREPRLAEWQGGKVEGIAAPYGPLGYRIIADPPLAGLEANARPDPNNIPNNHLSYAVQWFLFALTALVIYGIALRKRLAA